MRINVVVAGPNPPQTDEQKLARLIVRAVEVHQNSYDHAQSLEDTRVKLSSKDDPTRSNYYALDVHQAAEQVCAGTAYADLVATMLFNCWNEALDWAADQGYIAARSYDSANFSRNLDRIYDETKQESSAA